jgi:orotidine-5'-phosphate decarboxylase
MLGATKSRIFTEIHKIVPDSFFLLVPGVGAREEVYLKFVNTE